MLQTNEIQIKWRDNSLTLPLAVNSSVLDLALNAGVIINHSCKRGDCGQCLARVIESSSPDCKSGSIRELCRINARYPGVFQLAHDPNEEVEKAKIFITKIHGVEKVSDDIYLLRLNLAPNSRFSFRGGQYVSIILRDKFERSYSIASYDSDLSELRFYIKKISGGFFSQWLGDVKIGSIVRLRAPLGRFHLRNWAVKESWFLATGTGITPIYAMLNLATDEQIALCGKINILWGNRSKADLFLLDDLNSLVRKIGADLRFTFSRENLSTYRYVTDYLKGTHLSEYAVYAAGHPSMVKQARDLSYAQSIDLENFHSDAFAFSEIKDSN